MTWQLLVLVLAVISTEVESALYDHTDAAITSADLAGTTVVQLETKLSYVGRHFFNITLVPKWGCVAFGLLPAELTAITYENVQEYELVCPLFSQHAETTTDGVGVEGYKFSYEIFDSVSDVANAIEQDIKEVGTIFFDYTPDVTKVLLVTWTKATKNGADAEADPTNTYQLAIALVKAEALIEPRERNYYTFAIFNYEQVNWTGWAAPFNNSEYRALAGFVYGDNKGVQSLPFARSDDEIINYLPRKSSIIGTPGRYIYDVTDIPQRIGCLDVLDFPPSNEQPELLTTSVTTADIFGGTLIRIQGQCQDAAVNPPVRCGFQDINEDDQAYWKTEIGVYLSDYTVVCKTPRLELGRSKLALSSPASYASYPFQTDFYVNAITAGTAQIQIDYNSLYAVDNTADNITLKWSPALFGVGKNPRMNVTIQAYKTSVEGVLRTTEYYLGEVASDVGSYTISVANSQCSAVSAEEAEEMCDGYLIGYFSMIIQNYDSTPIDPFVTKRISISSIPVPIGWYVRDYHRSKYNQNNWYNRFCEQPAQPPLETPTCPCTRTLAQYDTRQFSPAPDCQRDERGAKCLLQADNSYCYNALSDTRSSVRCCYDSTSGNLIDGSVNPVVGSHRLNYYPLANYREFGIEGARTYLSYYLSHVKNHYACCGAQGLGATKTPFCAGFASRAQTPTRCVDHTSSSITAIVGDPHFKLSENQIFSFNGVGEYWFAYSSDSDLAKIQVRLAKATSRYATAPKYNVSATILQAVAIKFQSTVIQVQVQPLTYLYDPVPSTKRLMIIINGREVTWTNDEQVRFYEGFRIASSGENQDRFHITLLDGGALIACDYTETIEAEEPVSPGSMNCRISYSKSQRSEVVGLIGLEQQNGDYALVYRFNLTSAADLSNDASVHNFAKTWRVFSNETFFRYIGTSWNVVNAEVDTFAPNYNPDFINGGTINENAACGVAEEKHFKQCSYDYRSTGSVILAAQSKVHLDETNQFIVALKSEQEFCESLNIPFALVSTSNGNKVGSVATVKGCVRNYIPRNVYSPSLNCTRSGSTYIWTGTKVQCVRSALYDTLTAKTHNPYSPTSIEDLGVTNFSAAYLGRTVRTVLLYPPEGCIWLSDFVEPGTEPRICPLLASHATQSAGEFDTYQFFYEVVSSTDTERLALIQDDVLRAADNFDSSASADSLNMALIFTWFDASSNGSKCTDANSCSALQRNTYQVVLATSKSGKTYVMINYDKIQWSGFQLPGSSANYNSVAGFYFGDRKGNLQLPYSNSSLDELKKLLDLSTDGMYPGRYTFEVSGVGNPKRLGCYDANANLPRSTELLTISDALVDIYGSQFVRIQGACLDESSKFKCAFERVTSTGAKEWLTTSLYVRDANTGVCLTPSIPEIDVGWTRIGLSVDSGATYKYVNDIYFGTALNGGPVFNQLSLYSPLENFWLYTQPNNTIQVSWSNAFGMDQIVPVELLIVGYDSKGTAKEFQVIAESYSNETSISFRSAEKQCTGSECAGVLIGRFVVRIRSALLADALKTTDAQSAAVSSVLMPIGWYTNQAHTTLDTVNKAQWYSQFCEPSAEPIITQSLPQCPCTRDFAETEQRLFFKAPDCVRQSGQSFCLFSPNSTDCYTTLPTAKGHSIRCCYDTAGNLVPSTNSPLNGAYLLPYAVNTNQQVFNIAGTSSQLSYALSHVKNYFACCSVDLLQAKTQSANCNSLSYKRTVSKTCNGFVYSGLSDVVGDPHFFTTDGARYTFNGVGEYWYVFSRESDFATKIQLRFVQAVGNVREFTKATVLSAVAFEYLNSKVEIHVQPWSYRNAGNKYLMVLVDGKEQYFPFTHEMFHRNFKIVSNDNQDDVTVSAQKNGPLVHCSYKYASEPNFNGMFCSFSLPNSYQRLVFGLSGYWDGDLNNDLVPRDKIYGINFGSVDRTDIVAVHKNFSLSWAVTPTESLFTYFDNDWMDFNQNVATFIPELSFPPNYGYITTEQVIAACGSNRLNSKQCQYDYELTNSSFYASQTVKELDRVSLLRQNLDTAGEATCNYLDIPYAAVSYANGIAVGAIAEVSECLAGYDLVPEARRSFKCTEIEGSSPTWLPTPQTVCRDQRKLYGLINNGVPIDPSSPTLPPITLPSLPTRAINGIRFGGRPINAFSIVSETGCVVMKQNVTNVQIDGIPSKANDDAPMVCPLFASHSTTIPSSADTYSIRFAHLTGQDASLSELTNDIKAVSEGFSSEVDGIVVTDAFVFTWIDARSSSENCESATACNNPKRNSYEVVIAVTNDFSTYAIITYTKLQWIGGFTNSIGNAADSFGALHYGENRGTVKLPYAGTALNELTKLVSGGTLRGLSGRYFYRVDDRFERIGCYESTVGSSDEKLPITLNTYVADVYGGRRLVFQSVCLPDDVSQWRCGFSKNTASGYPATTQLYRLNNYTAACKAPHLPDIDVGEAFFGISNGASYLGYESTIYLDGALKDQTPLKLEDNLVWFSATSTTNMTVSWNPDWFPENTRLDVVLIGYKHSQGNFTKSEHPLGVAFAGEGAFVFDSSENSCDSNCEEMLIGQVAVRVANESAVILDARYEYLELSSTLVPIGWFVNKWHVENKKKVNWYEDYCDTSKVTAPLQCPCSSAVAQSDFRSFIPTPLCNSLFGSECLITPEASSCYTTLPLNTDGAGLLCCYTPAGNLIYSQEKPLAGSYALKYAPTARQSSGVSGATGYLSYYYSHPKNLFACCSANPSNVANELCYNYIQNRSVDTTCANFELSGASGIVGDPHILTTDRSIYTFNGVGEYWWVTDGGSIVRAVRVQVRFQNRFKSYLTSAPQVPLRAALFTSLVLHFGSTEIQIEVQGPSYLYGGGRKLALYVDGVEKFFNDYPSVQYFQGVRVYSQKTHDFIRLSTPYNGASVDCSYAPLSESTEVGAMFCLLIMPKTYQGKVYGLSGSWDNNAANDLVKRADIGNPSAATTNATDLTAVHDFGRTWRVFANESWFNYFGNSFEEVNREIDSFVPELTLTPESSNNISMINAVCPPGRAFAERCGYDYRITTSRNFATNTINALNGISTLQSFFAAGDIQYCPWIHIPYALIDTTAGVKLNSVANVLKCINGYQQVSAITQYRCTKSGNSYVWSPAVDLKTCIPGEVSTPAAIPTSQPGQTSGQPSTASTGTVAPLNDDSTAVIVLGVLLGVFALAFIVAVIYYFVSIKPKLKSSATTSPYGMEMSPGKSSAETYSQYDNVASNPSTRYGSPAAKSPTSFVTVEDDGHQTAL